MNEYRDHVTGCLAHRDEAGTASDALVQRGLPRARIQVFKHEEAPALDRAGSNAALKSMLVDGAIGAAVGTGLGAEKKGRAAVSAYHRRHRQRPGRADRRDPQRDRDRSRARGRSGGGRDRERREHRLTAGSSPGPWYALCTPGLFTTSTTHRSQHEHTQSAARRRC